MRPGFPFRLCSSFAMFVGLRWLPLVASSPNKQYAMSFALPPLQSLTLRGGLAVSCTFTDITDFGKGSAHKLHFGLFHFDH